MSVAVERAGDVWTVVLDRPQVRNAVDPDTAVKLYDAFVAFERDAHAKVAVLWGAGGTFCAGFDLHSITDGRAKPWIDSLHWGRDGQPPIGPMGPSRMQLQKPVIAAVSGAAVAGGLELAIWCDLRVMEESARMGVFCRRWGVPLLDGGTVRLPRLIGQGRALDLILTGREVRADEALRMGLCDRVVPTGSAREQAEALAAQIALHPQLCMRADRASAMGDVTAALQAEFEGGLHVLEPEAAPGAAAFSQGAGRHGAPRV